MPRRLPIDLLPHRRPAAALDSLAAHGAETYDRQIHLARVLPVGPEEIADDSAAGGREIVRRLARALRAERSRGRAGHWTYDLNRHIALAQAYNGERRLLAAAVRFVNASEN